MTISPVEAIALADPTDAEALLDEFRSMTDAEIDAVLRDWRFHARPEQLAPDWEWRWWLVKAGRGFGKALDDATPLPTPGGWVKMGDLAPGDVLFDETGAPCRVLSIHVQGAVPGWRLTFSDGTEIVACDEHQWVTLDALDRKRRNRRGIGLDGWEGRATITTADLVATLHRGKRGDHNHAIPQTLPLDLPDADLPIDPYLLGVWLGDGASAGAEVTCHDDDADHYRRAAEAAGEAWTFARRRHPDRPVATWALGARPHARDAAGRMTANGSMHSRLRALGVLGAKHVPAVYLRASAAQRLALLAGLVDTDGYVSPSSGHVEFTSTRRALADAVVELARSLGQRPTIAEGRATLNGRDCGPKWRVTWRPTIAVATLPRKVAALRPVAAQAMRSACRMVVDAERVDARPMRCIVVDSPSRLFLAGEGMIPTHNTRTGAEWVVDRCEQFAEAGAPQLVGLLNRSFDQVRSLQIDGESGLRAVCERRGHVLDIAPTSLHGTLRVKTDRGVHETAIEVHTGDDPDRVRGRNFGTVWADEVASWRHKIDEQGNTAFTNADLGLRALAPPGLEPRGVITTTPKAIRLIVDLVGGEYGEIAVTEGSTFDNLANLAPSFVQSVLRNYVGTRLAAQEIFGRLVRDVEGALWTVALIERNRRDLLGQAVRGSLDVVTHDERVVGVDPPGGLRTECGIVVAGRWSGVDPLRPHVDVIDDLSLAGPPEVWGAEVVRAFQLHGCDSVVAERNYGGEMVRSTIHAVDPTVPVRMVTATRGKEVRAQPVAVVYDVDRVHHVGTFGELESEQTTWVPTDRNAPSPNRLDAVVWAVTHLLPLHGTTGVAEVANPADRPAASLGRAAAPYSGKVR